MMEKAVYRGFIAQNGEDYVHLADIVGVTNVDNLIEIELDSIADNEFNRLLTGKKKVEILLEKKDIDPKIYGEIMGGSDPTRPARVLGEKMRPKQKLTILLEKTLNKEQKVVLIKERVKLIVYA